MLDPRGEGRIREFLLFSDCLVWLENEAASATVVVAVGMGRANANSGIGRPIMARSRSKSEAELSELRVQSAASASLDFDSSSNAMISSPPKSAPPTRAPQIFHQRLQRPVSSNVTRHASSISQSNPSSEEKWVFKGKAQLVDLEVVIVGGLSDGQERSFEVLSPEGSFAVYAGTQFHRTHGESLC